jgi:hypothetical protein
MKTTSNRTLTLGAWLVVLSSSNVTATQTRLAFRNESPQVIHDGLTAQIVDSTFGTNTGTLPFNKTTTYDFYSPRLVSSIALYSSDKGGGTIYMSNTGTTDANDFSVTGDLQYYDYNPNTGAETLIVDTTVSSRKHVNYGQTVSWDVPNVLLPAAMTISAGHMLHVAMTIALVSGNPTGAGQLVYNGSFGSSTSGLLPQNRAAVLNWTFDSAPLPPPLSIYPQANGQMGLAYYGAALTTCSIQASTNLCASNWTTLVTTNTDANGLCNFLDRDATNFPCRFYRSVTY